MNSSQNFKLRPTRIACAIAVALGLGLFAGVHAADMNITAATPDGINIRNGANAITARFTNGQQVVIPGLILPTPAFNAAVCYDTATGTLGPCVSVPSGAMGATGMAGATGPAGPIGATGIAGPAGPAGSGSATAGATGATGATGAIGPVGPNGTTGVVGSAGPTGSAGTAGATGANGAIGPAGANGTTGVAGPAGPTGSAGTAGATGANGAIGPAGPTGATGATGASGAGAVEFADFYALMAPDNAATVANLADVKFPNNGPAFGGITRLTSGTFNLAAIGTYQVMFQVSVDEPGQLAVALNGTVVANSVVGRATGTSQFFGVSLITTTAADTQLSIKNAGSPAALTITPKAGGPGEVSAHVVITRLR